MVDSSLSYSGFFSGAGGATGEETADAPNPPEATPNRVELILVVVVVEDEARVSRLLLKLDGRTLWYPGSLGLVGLFPSSERKIYI